MVADPARWENTRLKILVAVVVAGWKPALQSARFEAGVEVHGPGFSAASSAVMGFVVA
jgi:hypothetical protein